MSGRLNHIDELWVLLVRLILVSVLVHSLSLNVHLLLVRLIISFFPRQHGGSLTASSAVVMIDVSCLCTISPLSARFFSCCLFR